MLGADLLCPATSGRARCPPPRRPPTIDGYTVSLQRTRCARARTGDLDFTVTRDGRPVAGIQPYLGARGHLVALREGDLAYLHVHPHDGEQPAGAVPFSADFASAGRLPPVPAVPGTTAAFTPPPSRVEVTAMTTPAATASGSTCRSRA